MSTILCLCGKQKGHPSHIACEECFGAVSDEIRKEFLTLARTKRGSPSYYSAVRRVSQAVKDNLSKAKG